MDPRPRPFYQFGRAVLYDAEEVHNLLIPVVENLAFGMLLRDQDCRGASEHVNIRRVFWEAGHYEIPYWPLPPRVTEQLVHIVSSMLFVI